MPNHPLLCVLLLTGLLACCSGEVKAATENPDPTNALVQRLVDGQTTANVGEAKSPFEHKREELEKQARTGFETLINVLQPFGTVGTTRDVYIQQRTNRQGGVNVEFEVRSVTHKASFIAGPLNPLDGSPSYPGLTNGALLRLFESLHDGSDTRRKPEAMNEWYQATGKWSEAKAIAQTLRLAHAIGHQTNRVTRTEFVAVPLHLKNPTGTDVVVTPFYKVDLYTEDDSRLLGVEYRVGSKPPGKVTRWFNWPPIKVP